MSKHTEERLIGLAFDSIRSSTLNGALTPRIIDQSLLSELQKHLIVQRSKKYSLNHTLLRNLSAQLRLKHNRSLVRNRAGYSTHFSTV
jgi:hypothetical protein